MIKYLCFKKIKATLMYASIREKLKEAMRAKDSLRVEVLRGVIASVTNELVARGKMPQDILDDEGVLAVITRLSKQRKDSAVQFEKGGRQDLAEKEKKELLILEEFLPKMMEKEEIEKIARAKKKEMGVDDKSKIGVLIGAIMKELKGKADGSDVKEVVEGLF